MDHWKKINDLEWKVKDMKGEYRPQVKVIVVIPFTLPILMHYMHELLTRNEQWTLTFLITWIMIILSLPP